MEKRVEFVHTTKRRIQVLNKDFLIMTFVKIIATMLLAATYFHLIALFMGVITSTPRFVYLTNPAFQGFFGIVSILLAVITINREKQ